MLDDLPTDMQGTVKKPGQANYSTPIQIAQS